MTFCYAIKHGNVELLRHAIKKVCIIMQAPITSKSKYAQVLLRQFHIINTKFANSILQKMYLANALINLQGLPHTIYKMDLLLEHQNGKFKHFCLDKSSSL